MAVWRLVASDRYHVTPDQIRYEWTICDVWDAHRVLDLYEDLEILANAG